MSFFPAAFDPRAPLIGILDLVEIDAPSGVVRFMPGQEGVFRDRSGNAWLGSQLIAVNPLEFPRNGEAPAVELTLSYFQDPDAPDLITQLRETGDDLLDGRAVRFYRQPLGSHADWVVPQWDPVLVATLTIRGGPSFHLSGPAARRITIQAEGAHEFRRAVRPRIYTTADHNRLIGDTDNPSLGLMPTTARQEEKLYG